MTHVSNLASDIASALNRYSAENESNTPDYILAKFLLGCLAAWDNATRERERWYGRNPNEGPVGTISTLGPKSSLAVPAPPPDIRPTVELLRLGERAARYFADGTRTDEELDVETALKCIGAALSVLEDQSASPAVAESEARLAEALRKLIADCYEFAEQAMRAGSVTVVKGEGAGKFIDTPSAQAVLDWYDSQRAAIAVPPQAGDPSAEVNR